MPRVADVLALVDRLVLINFANSTPAGDRPALGGGSRQEGAR
jgi:hypothetical protein